LLAVVDVLKRNNVNIIGNGEKTIVLAHGFGCDQKMWKYITPSLEADYKLVLFDYVGAGNSDVEAYKTEKYSTLRGYAQDVFDILDTLKLRDITFIGHSISSMIGMIAAIERPDYFKQVLMIGPSACYLNEPETAYIGGFEKSDVVELLDMMEMNFTGWASYMAPAVMDDTKGPELVQNIESSFASTNPRIAREFAEVTFLSDNRKEVPFMTVPTLIIQCSEDSIVPIAAGEYLHAQMPNSTLQVLDAKGHYPHMSMPSETLQIITDYLDR